MADPQRPSAGPAPLSASDAEAVADALARFAERLHRVTEDVFLLSSDLSRLRAQLGAADPFEDSELGEIEKGGAGEWRE